LHVSVSLQLSQSTMTTKLPPGIYHINVAGGYGVEPARLTRHGEDGVTILPPGVERNPEQEWRITHGKDDNVIIDRPSGLIPTLHLTYKGAPKKPEHGDQIDTVSSEFPLNEWHLAPAPGFKSFIRVAGSELGIKISPATIHPPILDLSHENQLEWVFERVHHEHEL